MHFSLEKDDISFSLPTHLSVQQVEEDKDAEEEDKVRLVGFIFLLYFVVFLLHFFVFFVFVLAFALHMQTWPSRK